MTAEYPAAVAIVTSQAPVPSFSLSCFLGLLDGGLAGGVGDEFGKWERVRGGRGDPRVVGPLYSL